MHKSPRPRSLHAAITPGLILALVAVPWALPVVAAAPAEQIHLSWMGDSWAVTFTQPTPADTPPRVSWDSPGGEGSIAPTERPRTVHDADLQRQTKGRTGTTAWTARIPADATAYTVGDRTFPLAAVPRANDSLRIVFLADHSTTEEAIPMMDRIAALNPGLVLIGGDLAYGDEDLSLWDDWFDLIEPVAARVPWMPAPGNHDTECFSSGTNNMQGLPTRTPRSCLDGGFYRDRFVLPNGDTRYYAFDWGPLRVISLDTMAYNADESTPEYMTDKDAQRAFLVRALAERPDAWTIVFFHHAMYSSNDSHGSDEAVRADLESVLEAGGADLVLAGHDHHYERSWPLANGGRVAARTNESVEGAGVVYAVSGGGGRGLYRNLAEPQPEWSAFRNATFQVMVLDVSMDRIDAKAIRLDGTVLDSFGIRRSSTADDAKTPEVAGTGSDVPGIGGAMFLTTLSAVGFAARRIVNRRP